MCLTETWSNDSHDNAFFNLDGYKLFTRRDRCDTTSGIGGGILTYVRDAIKCSESTLPMYESFNQCSAIKV